jgi:hypothetical protein
MSNELASIVSALLCYSFDEVDWDFDSLASPEKKIVGTPEKLAEIRGWVGENS